MKKISLIVSLLCLVFPQQVFSKQGQHVGEQKMLDVEIQFSKMSGTTVTNANGVYYNFWGYVFYENKVYPHQYWGTYPLYFFGQEVGVTVKVTNKGPKEKAKLRIKVESYVLNTDGSNGVELMKPKIIDVEVNKNETKIIDASFVADYVEGADSGLDRFVVKVLHINEGGGFGNTEPALIMVKEGIFCPPKYNQKLK